MSSRNFFFELNLINISALCCYTGLHSQMWRALFPSILPLTCPELTSYSLSISLLTAKFLQRLFAVGFPVTALPDVAGLQFHHGLDTRQEASARLQVHLGKQLPAPSSRLVVHSLVPALKIQRQHRPSRVTSSAPLKKCDVGFRQLLPCIHHPPATCMDPRVTVIKCDPPTSLPLQ